MTTKIMSAAVCAAFFMAPMVSFADDRGAAPLVLVKEAVPTFSLEDFPWDLPEGRTENVTLPLGKAVLTMPWMEVEKDGKKSVTINTPELVISRDFAEGTHEGLILKDAEMIVRQLKDTMAASGFAKSLAIAGTDDDGPRALMEGFEFALTSSGYEPVIAAFENDADSGSDEVKSAMRGLNFAVDYSVKSSRIDFSDSGSGSIPFDVELSSGPSDSSVTLGDGRLGFAVKGVDTSFSANGPIPVEGEIGLISYDLSMPTEASDAVQPMQFGFEFGDVVLSDTIWALADPKKIFPRDFKIAKIDTTLDVILNSSMFDNVQRGGGAETLEPVAVTLSALELDGLGLDVSANGDVEMNGEIPKSISAYLSVAGLSEFMANVVKAGFVPQSQAILGEGIALQFANEEDDGSLTFDVKTEDGMVTINGNRVAPLPQ